MARLGTVAAAAKEPGINRSTCQKWAKRPRGLPAGGSAWFL
ncbi:hypothetical protein [Pseudarthrobacter sp. S9]